MITTNSVSGVTGRVLVGSRVRIVGSNGSSARVLGPPPPRRGFSDNAFSRVDYLPYYATDRVRVALEGQNLIADCNVNALVTCCEECGNVASFSCARCTRAR